MTNLKLEDLKDVPYDFYVFNNKGIGSNKLSDFSVRIIHNGDKIIIPVISFLYDTVFLDSKKPFSGTNNISFKRTDKKVLEIYHDDKIYIEIDFFEKLTSAIKNNLINYFDVPLKAIAIFDYCYAPELIELYRYNNMCGKIAKSFEYYQQFDAQYIDKKYNLKEFLDLDTNEHYMRFLLFTKITEGGDFCGCWNDEYDRIRPLTSPKVRRLVHDELDRCLFNIIIGFNPLYNSKFGGENDDINFGYFLTFLTSMNIAEEDLNVGNTKMLNEIEKLPMSETIQEKEKFEKLTVIMRNVGGYNSYIDGRETYVEYYKDNYKFTNPTKDYLYFFKKYIRPEILEKYSLLESVYKK